MRRQLTRVWSFAGEYGWSGLMHRAVSRISRKLDTLPIVSVICRHLKNRRAMARLSPPIKLHLGCGRIHLEGYVNIDVQDWAGICDVVTSATDLAMFPDDSVDHIFNHALLEHIAPWNTSRTIREWYRVLRPGGTIQIEVPDLQRVYEDWLVEGILSEEDAISLIYGGFKRPDKAYAAQDHLTGFTFDRLTRIMAEAGFDELVRREHDTYHHILVILATKPTR